MKSFFGRYILLSVPFSSAILQPFWTYDYLVLKVHFISESTEKHLEGNIKVKPKTTSHT